MRSAHHLEGFAPTRVTELILELGESKVIALELKPASVHETVTVSDIQPELTTDRPDRSVVIDPNFVANIPLNVRNPLQLINFSPAVTKGDDGLSGQNITSESRTNTWRINGAKAATTDLAIDGATDTTSYYNQAAGIPGIDAVQEYRVYTSAYAPEFGHTSGGDVSYALKSGGNAVSRHRSSSICATATWTPTDSTRTRRGSPSAPSGGTSSAALWAARFASRSSTTAATRPSSSFPTMGCIDSSAGSFTGTVPTALERAGNFSQTKDSNGNLIVIYDPSTTKLDPSAPAGTTRYIRTAFPGNIVPSNEINPIGDQAALLLSDAERSRRRPEQHQQLSSRTRQARTTTTAGTCVSISASPTAS